MATNLARSSDWPKYKKELDLEFADVLQVCRLYALLHDVGHLPLSHLFEYAFEDYVFEKSGGLGSLRTYCSEWFGGDGFEKLHEACGSAVAPQILESVAIGDRVKKAVIALLQKKHIDESDPLRPLKLLVDSDIDADRIDATARDGFLAGREYGNYDIERLCTSVFVQHRGSLWRIGYSHKALGSIEGLLFDRLRTHTWIHFHHRVVAMKVAASFLLSKLLLDGTISAADFPIQDHRVMGLRDDVWLWTRLREFATRLGRKAEPPDVRACCDALLFRSNSEVVPLWKNRSDFLDTTQHLVTKLSRAAIAQEINPRWFGRQYEKDLSVALGATAVVFWLKFAPISHDSLTPLTDEYGKEDRGHLLETSSIVDSLESTWSRETRFYVILLGPPSKPIERLREDWVNFTYSWIQQARAGKHG